MIALFFLKSIIYLAVLFGFYGLVLKNTKRFALNRLYLNAILGLGLVLPFFNIPSTYQLVPSALPTQQLNEIILSNAAPTYQSHLSWIDFYCSGVAIAASLLIYRLIQTLLIVRKAKKETNQDYFVSDHNHAFTFLGQIIIGKFIDPEARKMIATHEQVHKEQLHFIDLIFGSLMKVVLWFNPFVYLAFNELKKVHEFEADAQTAAIFGRDYQYTLLNSAMDTRVFPLAHSFFNTNTIKTRIMMMNNSKNHRGMLGRYALILPLLAGLVYTQACTQPTDQVSADAEETVETLNSKEVDKMPSFENGQDGLIAYFQDNFNYPKAEYNRGIEGKVMVEFVVDREGKLTDVQALGENNNANLEKAAIDFVAAMPAWEPGEKDGKTVSVKMVLPIRFELPKITLNQNDGKC